MAKSYNSSAYDSIPLDWELIILAWENWETTNVEAEVHIDNKDHNTLGWSLGKALTVLMNDTMNILTRLEKISSVFVLGDSSLESPNYEWLVLTSEDGLDYDIDKSDASSDKVNEAVRYCELHKPVTAIVVSVLEFYVSYFDVDLCEFTLTIATHQPLPINRLFHLVLKSQLLCHLAERALYRRRVALSLVLEVLRQQHDCERHSHNHYRN